MADMKKTNIQWTDYSWNCWQGCTKVSSGCANCYMFSDKKRYNQNPEKVIRSKDKTFYKPLAKNRNKEYKIESGSKIFVCSWSDFFHPKADEWRDEAWAIIKQRPDVIFQIVTKRTNDLATRLPADWGSGYPNVWLIVSVESTATLPRVEKLLKIPAALHGVSYEPALELVDFSPFLPPNVKKIQHDFLKSKEKYVVASGRPSKRAKPTLSWIIVGGESGDNARPFQHDWARKTINACKDSGIDCFVKQMGSMAMEDNQHILYFHEKGGDPEEWPEDLRVQDFPRYYLQEPPAIRS